MRAIAYGEKEHAPNWCSANRTEIYTLLHSLQSQRLPVQWPRLPGKLKQPWLQLNRHQTSQHPPSLSIGRVSYQSLPLLKDFIFLTQQNKGSFMQDWNIANLIKVNETLSQSVSGNNTKALSVWVEPASFHNITGLRVERWLASLAPGVQWE